MVPIVETGRVHAERFRPRITQRIGVLHRKALDTIYSIHWVQCGIVLSDAEAYCRFVPQLCHISGQLRAVPALQTPF